MQLLAQDKIKITGTTRTLERNFATNAHTNNTCAKTDSANLQKAKNNILNNQIFTIMLTPKMTGIFDCRKYDQSGKKSHDQRELLADTDNVTFSALFPLDGVPEVFMVNGQLDEFAHPKVSKRERLAAQAENREPVADVVCVKFKIGQNVRWFNEHAKPCDRPTNVELEANRWNVQIDFARKEKDTANPLKPSGYWCNNIMVEKVENNPFAGKAFSPIDEPEPEDTDPAENQPADQPKETKKNDDLPF